MQNVSIRKATKDDVVDMLNLVKELALFEKAPEQVTITLDEFIQSGFGANPVYWAFIAEVNAQIVGMALCYVRFSTWKGNRCYLEDIIINEKFRNQGLGKQLMDRVIADAKEKKFSGVVWQVLDWNTSALEFYKKYNASLDAEWINCAVNF